MVWQVVFSLAPSLSDDFRNALEELNKVLTGASRSEDLWKRCIGETDGAIGMALGALYVKKTFEGTSKQQVRFSEILCSCKELGFLVKFTIIARLIR